MVGIGIAADGVGAAADRELRYRPTVKPTRTGIPALEMSDGAEEIAETGIGEEREGTAGAAGMIEEAKGDGSGSGIAGRQTSLPPFLALSCLPLPNTRASAPPGSTPSEGFDRRYGRERGERSLSIPLWIPLFRFSPHPGEISTHDARIFFCFSFSRFCLWMGNSPSGPETRNSDMRKGPGMTEMEEGGRRRADVVALRLPQLLLLAVVQVKNLE